MMKYLLSATLLLLSTLSYAEEVPNTFSSGDTISSSQINANFAYLANAIKNDEVTAMMVCNRSGLYNDTFYYALCYSTRIQLVSATPYESETIGFSTKYKTTVMISI